MNLPDNWLLLIVIGVVSGILSGTIGVGAGIIMVPALSMMAFGQKDAQGIALAVMVPMALVGAIRYRLNPEIDLNINVAGLLAVGALIGVFFGTAIAGALPAATLRKIFAIFMVIAAVRMFTLK
ncbi:MAG: sulfite exporter TauE/SafE family protein [Verrucomicrobiota bacterium]